MLRIETYTLKRMLLALAIGAVAIIGMHIPAPARPQQQDPWEKQKQEREHEGATADQTRAGKATALPTVATAKRTTTETATCAATTAGRTVTPAAKYTAATTPVVYRQQVQQQDRNFQVGSAQSLNASSLGALVAHRHRRSTARLAIK